MWPIEQEAYEEPLDVDKLAHDREPLVVHTHKGKTAKNLILLIHGLRGHRYGYWTQLARLLFDDFPKADIGLYFYRTGLKRIGLFKSIDLEDEAEVLAEEISNLGLYESVTLVGHSMGGLLAKAAIVRLLEIDSTKGLKRLSGLILLACPQIGSTKVPRMLQWCSTDARVLYPHNKLLQRMETVFASQLQFEKERSPLAKRHLPTWAIIASEDFWVDKLSAGITVPVSQRHPVRGDHSEIIEPQSAEASSYKFIRSCLDTTFRPAIDDDGEDEELLLEPARLEDLPALKAMASAFFGEDISSDSEAAEFVNHGLIIVSRHVIAGRNEKRERVMGYFCVVPLSDESAEGVMNGSLRGRHLTVREIPKQAKAKNAYVGAIAAYDHYSRAVVLEALKLQIEQLRVRGVKVLLTRPYTKRGLALVDKYAFRPVDKPGLGELYVRELNKRVSRGIRLRRKR
jgi:pimeloyl-ACP methyl ester carboxylesterase